ncbi:MAG: beta-hydroxyacyl-ACP dehydratase [Planctomycetes bacterium]|nr:beta-hydroxyacyl-ACP dehydratase [Planctomycetota bacterium]
MRFSLLDRITELEAGRSVTAVKTLSLAEEYLADHFPGFPVMPGVLMLESLVQAGAWLMRFTVDFQYSTVLLKEARAVRFNSFVTPGRMLTVSVSVHRWEGNECVLKGTGTVEGTSAVSARLTLQQFNLADSDPALAAADRQRSDVMRALFEQLYTAPPKG